MNRSRNASLLALVVAGVCVTAALAVAGCSSGGGSSDDGAGRT